MEEALVARMLAAAAISAIAGPRVNWGFRVQGEGGPGVTLFDASPGRTYTYKGASGLAGPRVQVDCWAADFATAKALARAVIATLEPPATVAGITFQGAFLANERGPSTEDLGGGRKVHRVSLDFFVWFSPAA
ncbi:MAG: hypothetical protein APF82_01000 [Sphingomonadales bacterium BRH_c42]|nr:MAG: hypothetical protein APF82_01000 [Sphingomonadales bacterium BRH_c42]